MFKLKIQFNTDNDAFENDYRYTEIDRILRDIADKAARGMIGAPIYDINGNAVGKWSAAT